MFFSNSSSSPITSLRVELSEQSQVLRSKLESPDPSILSAAGVPRVESRSRVTLQCLFECLAPFVDSPVLTMSFVHGGLAHAYPLPLPLCAPSFVEAVAPLEKDAFMQRWGTLAGEREAQEIVQLGRPVGAEDMLKVLKIVTEGIRMARCPAVDAANSVSAVGTFRTGAKDAAGNPVNVGCLVRVDGSGNAIRVTARTMHPSVSKAMKNVIVGAIK